MKVKPNLFVKLRMRFFYFQVFLMASALSAAQVDVHYLGHSAFLMQFDNGVSVLSDFGTSNSYGLASPIYDIGDFIPTVVTYSHRHTDHYDINRRPLGCEYLLENTNTLEIDGLSIKPVRVCESATDTESSTAFIFEYEGMRICHLSDAQANIMDIENSLQRQHIQMIFPDQIDLLLMTIQGTNQFIPEAELFVNILKPRHIIPMHYWTVAYKQEFLDHLTAEDGTDGKNYNIFESGAARFVLTSDMADAAPVQVISLSPAPFGITSFEEKPTLQPEKLTPEIHNYPNPFNEGTVIDYMIPEANSVGIQIIDIDGNAIKSLVQSFHNSGKYQISWDGTDNRGMQVASGIYLCHLKAGLTSKNTKLLISK